MPKTTPVLFKRSLIALAILSTSACSSLPQVSDINFGGVGEGIAKAGKATADATRNTWNTTVNLLGFGNSQDGQSNKDEGVSDEQLLVATNDANQELPKELLPVLKTRESLTPSDVQRATVAAAESSTEPMKDLIPVVSLDTVNEVSATSDKDMVHEVVIGENLWQIAKKTTGNAKNWHLLAEFNNLQPDAAVFVGQKLVIPSRLVLEEQATAFTQGKTKASIQDVALKLNTGETLWEFSKRTTGDATNWQAIADHNNFTEKQSVTVYPGQIIVVPRSLISAGNDVAETSEPARDNVTPIAVLKQVVDTAVTEPAMGAALADAAQELAETRLQAVADGVTHAQAETTHFSLTDQSHAMAIMKAAYREEDKLEPVYTTENVQAVKDNTDDPEVIMISGTYYPKAVYNAADFSSNLLMRVSPGTALQVSKLMGSWYEVETDEGVGYVHQRDIN